MGPEDGHQLTDDLLVLLAGEIVFNSPDQRPPAGGTWSIHIPLAPFSASDQYAQDWRVGTDGPEIIKTAIRLELIVLPGERLDDLAGRTFVFPLNPTDGFIDGSSTSPPSTTRST